MWLLQLDRGYLKYPVGDDFIGSVVNGLCEELEVVRATAGTEEANIGNSIPISRLAFVREVPHRTPSTSTASSSSRGTEDDAEWWEATSPWAWKWTHIEPQKVGGKGATQGLLDASSEEK